MKGYHFTQREEELMDMLWDNSKPMTSVEMLEYPLERSWKDNYIHIMLRSLQKKGAIRVCGTVQYGTQYARQFEAAITKEEYATKLLVGKGLDVRSLIRIGAALLKENGENKNNVKLINELERIAEELEE